MKLFILLAAIVLPFAATAAENSQLPVEAFASRPSIDYLKLSPDGNKLSMVQIVEGKDDELVLVKLYDLQKGESKYLVKSESRKMRINSLRWANNEQLLMNASYASYRGGTPVMESRLVLIDVNTGKNRSALSNSIANRLVRTPQFQTNVVDYLPEDPNNILLALDGFSTDIASALVKINLQGKLSSVLLYGKKDLIDWVTDRNHQPRIATFYDKAHYKIKLWDNDERELVTLWEFDSFSEQAVWPIGFSEDPNTLFVSAYHEGRRAIFSVNLAQSPIALTLVNADEQYDVPATMEYSWHKKRVIALGGDYIDDAYIALQKALDKAIPDADNHIIDFSDDENRYIVFSTSDDNAGTYFLGDRKAGTMTYLLDRYALLASAPMAKKNSISYKARDGLQIEGYLTKPLLAGQEGFSGKLPTIIFPHGGPISYDDGSFDYWTQFFANRGYAVLQMNFRGSSGYGFDFMKAGLQNWGLQMQDDVEDGTRWLIEQGVADPNRICIVGASYGGYAALMGAIKSPDLFKCVVSFAGVTDVERLVKDSRRFTNFETVKKQIGDDYAMLEQRSPVNFASKIQVPVLLIHGDNDRSVPVKHSRNMFDELKDEHKDVQYIELEDGDHYLSINEHRLTTFKAMDTFLQRFLATPAS